MELRIPSRDDETPSIDLHFEAGGLSFYIERLNLSISESPSFLPAGSIAWGIS